MDYSIKLLIIILLGFCMAQCSNQQKQGVDSEQITSSYKIHKNKIIQPGAYWYYQLEDGDNNVYEIYTEREKVVFECNKENFEISDGQLFEAKCLLITKDGRHYVPAKGSIKCKKLSKKKLEIEMELDGVEIQKEEEITSDYLKSVEKYDCHVSFRGKCKKLD